MEVRVFEAFNVRQYDGYVGRNPKTGEETVVEAKRPQFFKAGKDVRGELN